MRVSAECLSIPGRNTPGPCSSLAGAGSGTGGSAVRQSARRRNLDRAGHTRPWFPPVWRMACSHDQCGRSIVRHAFTCAQYPTDTESGANARRELLRKCAGKHVLKRTDRSRRFRTQAEAMSDQGLLVQPMRGRGRTTAHDRGLFVSGRFRSLRHRCDAVQHRMNLGVL